MITFLLNVIVEDPETEPKHQSTMLVQKIPSGTVENWPRLLTTRNMQPSYHSCKMTMDVLISPKSTPNSGLY